MNTFISLKQQERERGKVTIKMRKEQEGCVMKPKEKKERRNKWMAGWKMEDADVSE